MIKNVKLVELNIKIVTTFLNTETLKMIANVYVETRIIKKSLMKS